MIREATVEDIPKIIQLDPSRQEELTPGPTTIGSVLVLADDCVVAYGTIKLFAEAVIATNKHVSRLTQASAIKELMLIGTRVCKSKGIEELNCFTNDSEYAELLRKHFGFVGIPEKGLTVRLE